MGVKKTSDFSSYPRRSIVLPDASGGQREEELPAGELGLDGSYKHSPNSGPIFTRNGSLNTSYFKQVGSGRGLFTLAGTALEYMRKAALKAGLEWVKEIDKKSDTIFTQRFDMFGDYYYHNFNDQVDFFKKNNILAGKNPPTGSIIRTYDNKQWIQKPSAQNYYDPVPGTSIFGTGLAFILPKFSPRMMAWIQVNASTYGFTWSTDVPISDPLFPRIMHYYFGTAQPPYWSLSKISIRCSGNSGWQRSKAYRRGCPDYHYPRRKPCSSKGETY